MPTTCPRCLLPDGAFGLQVPDSHEACDHCRYWDQHGGPYRDYDALGQRLRERFHAVRGRQEYDALVGLSGGKDSTYVLLKLARDYELNVLAVTFDNGFLTDFALDNIARVVEALGVDHYFERPDWSTHRAFYEGAFRKLGDPCVACAMAGYFLAIKVSHERGIPFFVHGRSPFQMFRNFHDESGDVFLSMLKLAAAPYSAERLLGLHRVLDRHVGAWLDHLLDDPADRAAVRAAFFIDTAELQDGLVPESLPFFLYHPYDEARVKQAIERELGYERAQDDAQLSHADCLIHDASARLYEELHGVSMIAPELAVMLRWGEISQREALDLLTRDGASPAALAASIERFCARVGVQVAEFHETIETLRSTGVAKFASH
jgi:hypothetical protein